MQNLSWIKLDWRLSFIKCRSFCKIIGAKLLVPIVTLSTKDNVILAKQVSDGFKRSFYWNNYQTIPTKVINQGTNIYELLSSSFQGGKRLFVLVKAIVTNAANNEADIKENKKYFLPKGNIENYNVLIDVGSFYDQPINDLIKQYDEGREVSAGQCDNYTTGCLLDYAYFKDNCRLIAVDLSKQKAIDTDLRSIQPTVFQGVVGGDGNTRIWLYTVLEKSKEAVSELYNWTSSFVRIYKWFSTIKWNYHIHN